MLEAAFGTAQAGTPILFPNGNPPAFTGRHLPPGQAIVFPGVLVSDSLEREIRLQRKIGDTSTPQSDVRFQYRTTGNQAVVATPLVDPRRARQMRAELEKEKNWLSTKAKDQQTGEYVHADSQEKALQDLENNSDRLDPTFKTAVSAKQPAAPAVARRPEYADPAKRETASKNADPHHGAHTSPELSLSDMLAPLDSATPLGSQSQTSLNLQDLLGSSDGATGSGERGNQGPLGLLGVSGNSSASPGARDPLNFSVDVSRQPLQPSAGLPATRAEPHIGFSTPTRSDLGARSAPGSLFPAGGLNQGSSRIIGFSSLPSPVSIKPPAAQPPSRWSPTGPDRDQQRRRF